MPLEKETMTPLQTVQKFELDPITIMRNCIVSISTCDWPISKFVSKLCLGGLGSCVRTVKL